MALSEKQANNQPAEDESAPEETAREVFNQYRRAHACLWPEKVDVAAEEAGQFKSTAVGAQVHNDPVRHRLRSSGLSLRSGTSCGCITA